MPKKNNVITIQQNQVLEIPNDNINIEPQEIQETPVDTIETQELHQDIVETVELQDVKPDLDEPVVKVKKTRVKKRKSLLKKLNKMILI